MNLLYTLVIAALSSFGHHSQSGINTLNNSTVKVIVNVKGIEKVSGQLRIAIYNEENEFPSNDDILDHRIVDVSTSDVQVVFEVQKQGVYAIAMMHDVNGNGKMDFNFIGFPKEPYGFSRNPGVWTRAPRFDECKFELKNSEESIEILL